MELLSRSSRGVLCGVLILACFVDDHDATQPECCDSSTASCTACRQDMSEELFCKTYPETFACRNRDAHPCNATDACVEPGTSCSLGLCVAQPLMSPCMQGAPTPSFPTPGCKPPECCTNLNLAVCVACSTGATVEETCTGERRSLVGCPLCSRCNNAACSVALSEERVVTTSCVAALPPSSCVGKGVEDCAADLSCAQVLVGQSWTCQSLSTFCRNCTLSFGECAVIGREAFCSEKRDDPFAFCPPERRCHGADSQNVQSRFCCAEDEMCDMHALYGGNWGQFGGQCVKKGDPCSLSRTKCGRGECFSFEGTPECPHIPPTFLRDPEDCPVGQRAFIVDKRISCEKMGAAPLPECNSLCSAEQNCRVSVANGSVVSSCEPLAGEAACNLRRVDASLSTCDFGCLEDNTCVTAPSAFARCIIQWPPIGYVTCNRHSQCPANEYCTRFLRQPLCNGTTSAVHDWLPRGVFSCEPARYACAAGDWDDEEAAYCSLRGIVSATQQHNCYDDDSDSWPTEKRTLCCAHTGIGCTPGVDCMSHPDAWGAEKFATCCLTQHICPHGAIPTPVDSTRCPDAGGCHADYCNINTLPWSTAQKQWCCANEQVGCRKEVETDCASEELTQHDKDWCCAHKNAHCAYDCMTNALKAATLWGTKQKQFCCDTFHVGCTPGYDLLECAGKVGLNETTLARCCDLHGIGCAHDCSADNTADPAATEYCCRVKGLGACEAPTKAPSTLIDVTGFRIALKVQGDWLRATASPRAFTDAFRASLASCNPTLAGEAITHIQLYCVSLNLEKETEICKGSSSDILVKDEWETRFEKAWVNSSAQAKALEAGARGTTTPLVTPAYAWPQNFRVDVDVSSRFSTAILDCVTDPTLLLSTNGGTAAPVILAALPDRYSIIKHSLILQVLSDGRETPSPPTFVPQPHTASPPVAAPVQPTPEEEGEHSHILLAVGIAFGSIVGCLGALLVACTMRKKEAPKESGEHAISINQFRSLELALKANKAEGEELSPITTDHMGWVGDELEERRNEMEHTTGSAGSLLKSAPTSFNQHPLLSLANLQQLQKGYSVPPEAVR